MTDREIEAAAAAIANQRAARRGMPEVTNVLELLRAIKGGQLYHDAMADARAALQAAEKVRAGS